MPGFGDGAVPVCRRRVVPARNGLDMERLPPPARDIELLQQFRAMQKRADRNFRERRPIVGTEVFDRDLLHVAASSHGTSHRPHRWLVLVAAWDDLDVALADLLWRSLVRREKATDPLDGFRLQPVEDALLAALPDEVIDDGVIASAE